MDLLFKILKENDIIITGNGSACVISFQCAIIKKGQRLFSNSGCASMGYGLPASIGACISKNNSQRIICIEGDGSVMMNLQELQTVYHNKLNIKIIILNNNVTNDVSLAAGSSTSDIQLMARAINGEARGEPYEGQVAVGAVILNRVKSSQFPNTVSGVIYQSGAFTAVSDGQINVPIAENSSVYKAARDAMNGWDPTGGCIYYFNPNTATNKWIWSRPLVKVIGKHRFCK